MHGWMIGRILNGGWAGVCRDYGVGFQVDARINQNESNKTTDLAKNFRPMPASSEMDVTTLCCEDLKLPG